VKKSIITAVCIIVLCSLVALPLSLRATSSSPQLSLPASQGGTQPETQASPQPTLSSNSDAPSQNTSPEPVPPEIPENTPVVIPRNPQQTGLQPTSSNGYEPTNRTTVQAIADGTSYFSNSQEPYALLLLDVLYRRFGVAEFADSLQRYDQILAENPDNAPLLRIFRRIADYNNTLLPEDFFAVTADVDKITVPALYSDRGNLPDDYVQQLNDAANSGGYLLTHVVLATIWLQDNHCDIGYDFKEAVYQTTAGLVDDDQVVTDLELEAAAFLYVAGQGALVDGAFVERVIATQNYDGGWSYSSGMLESSNWHTSVLGLMLLLHVEFPAASYPPMISTPTYTGLSSNQPILSVAMSFFSLEIREEKWP
jgi:hypothetical protein